MANLKGTAYNTLARVYPNLEQVYSIAQKERSAFVAVRRSASWKHYIYRWHWFIAQDDNYGLLRLVVERAPRWAIRKLTETYLTLSLGEIGRAAGIEDVAEVRRIVLSMVRTRGVGKTASGQRTYTVLGRLRRVRSMRASMPTSR